MPVPAVFVIGADGAVAWSFANSGYTIRLSVGELLAVAKERAGR